MRTGNLLLVTRVYTRLATWAWQEAADLLGYRGQDRRSFLSGVNAAWSERWQRESDRVWNGGGDPAGPVDLAADDHVRRKGAEYLDVFLNGWVWSSAR